MIGGVGWYRKDFSLPDASKALEWAVRFESVNYRSTVWLNGRRVGSNRGAYIPFEFRLKGLKRTGTNRLVVRVDSKRRSTDFPPSGLATNGAPTGGWWNYSGLQREVYLKRLDTVDWKSVRVIPRLACARCTASVQVKVIMRNVRGSGQNVRISGSFGSRRLSLGSKGISGNGVASFTTTFKDRKPRVWSPARPYLYNVNLRASAGGRTVGDLPAQDRHPLDPRLQRRAADPQRRAREPARRRRPRGLPAAGLRGRQRVPPAPGVGGQGGGRDADADPLPDAPLHARARRQGGRAHLVGDPGLRDQDRQPGQDERDDAGGEGAREEHHRQPEPPVGAAVVDRQRAVRPARPDAGQLHQDRGPPGQGARPEPPGRHRGRRLPDGRLPERPTSRST